MDAAGQRVLDRHEPGFSRAGLDGIKGLVKCLAGQDHRGWTEVFKRGGFRICPALALDSDWHA